MAQVATVVITPSGVDMQISAEVDQRPDGYNGGKTQFGWGDAVYLALYNDGKATNITAGATAGTISAVKNNESITIKDLVQFVEVSEASPSKPVISLSSMTWFGGAPQQRTPKASNGKIVLEFAGSGTPPAVGVYVGKATYTTKANIYKLVLPQKPSGADADYQVMVWFKAE